MVGLRCGVKCLLHSVNQLWHGQSSRRYTIAGHLHIARMGLDNHLHWLARSCVRQMGGGCALTSDPIETASKAQDIPLVAGDHTRCIIFCANSYHLDPMSPHGKTLEPVGAW